MQQFHFISIIVLFFFIKLNFFIYILELILMANSNVKLDFNVELMINKLYKPVHYMISNNLLMAYYVKVINIKLNPF